MLDCDLPALATTRARLRATYLHPGATRPPTTARGVHHVALRPPALFACLRCPLARASCPTNGVRCSRYAGRNPTVIVEQPAPPCRAEKGTISPCLANT